MKEKMSGVKKELEATWNHKPFKKRGEVEREIRDCNRFAGISQYACFIFAALGVIGDALGIRLDISLFCLVELGNKQPPQSTITSVQL